MPTFILRIRTLAASPVGVKFGRRFIRLRFNRKRLKKGSLQAGKTFSDVYSQGKRKQMGNNYLKYIIPLFVLLTIAWIISCSGRSGKAPEENKAPLVTAEEETFASWITMTLPAENTEFKLGEPVKVVLAQDKRGEPPDSVLIFFDGKSVTSLRPGSLYEGTGQETGSSLREVELETGKVLRQLNLLPPLFGEGITLYKERIYQVTWKSKVGFVYDKATFGQINKVYYQTEGWGLTTMNDQIIMSDGTNVLYFLEPEMFTVVSRLEVYDNEKKADQLNELEYINGEIWANMWMTDMITSIDPLSGKVVAYIDLRGIMKDPDTKRNIN